MKAVFLDYASLDKNDLDFQALHAVFDELILYPSTDAETLVARVQDADVIISNKVLVDADTLKKLGMNLTCDPVYEETGRKYHKI